MPYVFWQDKTLEMSQGESVLDCLLRHGIDASYGCKKGVCQSCKLKAIDGNAPFKSQEGLRDPEKLQGYFLSCQAHPTESMRVDYPSGGISSINATVISLVHFNGKVMRLRLKPLGNFSYRGGQYINLHAKDDLIRSYSMASSPHFDGEILEFHIAVCKDGQMSEWLSKGGLKEGDIVKIDGPIGNCFYTPCDKDLLLIGFGTGLAPLYGLIREAFHYNHCLPITLVIGNRPQDDLYHLSHLKELEEKGLRLIETDHSSIIETALAHIHDPDKTRVYICGPKSVVMPGQTQIYLKGVPLSEIYADAFFSWEKPDSVAV